MSIGNIALLVLLFASAGEPVSPGKEQVKKSPVEEVSQNASDEDIIVSARKLNRWRGLVKTVRGKIICKTKRTSKDQSFDEAMCDILTYCVAQMRDDLEVVEKMPRPEKSAQYRAANAKIGACLRAKAIEKGYAKAGLAGSSIALRRALG